MCKLDMGHVPYFRSFVIGAFKALQMHHSLHSQDIQTAVEYCEETVQEIQFTDFLLKTCNHIQQDIKKSSSISNPDQADAEEKLNLENVLKTAKSCSEVDNNHSVIKKKFHDIISNTFQLVPHANDLYYYCPDRHHHHIGDDLFPVPSRIRRDTKDTGSSTIDDDNAEDIQIKMKMITDNADDEKNKNTNMKGTWPMSRFHE